MTAAAEPVRTSAAPSQERDATESLSRWRWAASLRTRLGRRRFVRRYFEQLDTEYVSLCAPEYQYRTTHVVDELRVRNTTAPSWENNHRFEYVIWSGLEAPVLKQRTYLEQYRLRMLIGAETADAAFTNGEGQKQHEKTLALGLLSEVQRTRMLQSEFAKLRSWLTISLLSAGGVFAYFIASHLFFGTSGPSSVLPPAGFTVLAGLLGGYFSVLLRLGRLQWSNDYTVNHHQIDRLFLNVVPVMGLAMFEGAVAALVLYTLFLSGVIEGSIFPHFSSDETWGNWQASSHWLWLAPENSYGMAKLIVWSILAGFSERLVPDLLASLSKNAENANASSTTAKVVTKNQDQPEA